MNTEIKRIAVAIIIRDGRVLVQQRPPGTHLGGMWEFPGGKIQGNETPSAAAARECREELLCAVIPTRELPVVFYQYEDFAVELHPILCSMDLAQSPQAASATTLKWVTLAELGKMQIPPANHALIGVVEQQFQDHGVLGRISILLLKALACFIWSVPLLFFIESLLENPPGSSSGFAAFRVRLGQLLWNCILMYIAPFTSSPESPLVPAIFLLLCPLIYLGLGRRIGILSRGWRVDFVAWILFILWSVFWLSIGIGNSFVTEMHIR
ncbi:(deoxy)nucleoside triphosphate pyrophosphohydrolase [Candidatus Sumerlaeota bacterium]|nr:(deoxy)nucleoside triphosphate pyrophosphohydrolase [Candidatus Sumerlaeota bacterium]